MTLELTVTTPPVAKARPRVTTIGGKPRAYTPAKTKHAEWIIRQAWEAKFGCRPLTGPVALRLVVWLPMPRSTPRSQRAWILPSKRPDLENFAKTALDALNGMAYVDDAQVISLVAEKRYLPFDGGSGRWEIALEMLGLDNPEPISRRRAKGIPHIPATEEAHDEEGAPARRRTACAAPAQALEGARGGLRPARA